MAKIRQLSSSIIRKIAAGQVVERPASVVKELLENSLDARAHFIKIIIENGGSTKIAITDDGSGISSDQLELACQPHTTSKIYTDDDLECIQTLGFRGEALASIALVSEFYMQSRTQSDDIGREVLIRQGQLVQSQVVGMPTGTTVIVKQLFQGMPARRKGLKSDVIEFRAILDVVIGLALAHPEVGFFLQHNHKVVLELSERQSYLERVQLLLGSEYRQHSLVLEGRNQSVHWYGLLGKPQLAQKNQQHQYLLVNKRAVRDRVIAQALRRAFGSLIEPRLYPFFVLYVELDSQDIDVNVHPRKETITFRAQNVASLISQDAQNMIEQHNMTYQNTLDTAVAELMVRDADMNQLLAKNLKKKVRPWQPKQLDPEEKHILQIDDTYLILATSQGLFMIDQHAAHERILFEQFKQQLANEITQPEVLQLTDTVSLQLPITQYVFLQQCLSTFAQLGFSLQLIDASHTVCVTQVPVLFASMDIRQIITDVLTELEVVLDMGEQLTGLPSVRAVDKTLSYLACRSAIKAGDQLSQQERQNLVAKLLTTQTQYTCPHGRPTQVELSVDELERLFHRR